jgi:hypothetical protein
VDFFRYTSKLRRYTESSLWLCSVAVFRDIVWSGIDTDVSVDNIVSIFKTELGDGSSRLLRNGGTFLPTYTASHPNLSSHVLSQDILKEFRKQFWEKPGTVKNKYQYVSTILAGKGT